MLLPFHNLDLQSVWVWHDNNQFSLSNLQYLILLFFWQHFNVNKKNELNRFLWGQFYRMLQSNMFWFRGFWKQIEGSGEFELLKNENKRNEVEEKKQILSEYPTWKFVFFYVTPKRFSSIKVGLCIFFNLDSFKTKENDLKIHLYGLVVMLNLVHGIYRIKI